VSAIGLDRAAASSTRGLRIAWLGPAPGEGGGVPGVNTELLDGLARRGHRIDCFFPSSGQVLPARLLENPNLKFVWGTSEWQWDRWYSRSRMTAFASGMVARGYSSIRLRQTVTAAHRREPYDVVYQFSSIESLSVPSAVTRSVPLVIHPETHSAGELRALIAERAVSRRCEPLYRYVLAVTIMLARTLVQRVRIRRATLLVCISSVFRDHMVRDYGFPRAGTVVVPNPVRIERFPGGRERHDLPPRVLVLGRIAVRKGVEDVLALARLLRDRGVAVRIRVVGGPSLWSDYSRLLDELPPETAEYVGPLAAAEIPDELRRTDVLLQASHYEPFGLTVAEALAAGVAVLATTEVGAAEDVDQGVLSRVSPGDIAGMADALVELLARGARDGEAVAATARAEAQRLFAPAVVCEQIAEALERLVASGAGPVTRPGSAS
jgi:glycosyltransferase involved in cell wall biosynthesis